MCVRTAYRLARASALVAVFAIVPVAGAQEIIPYGAVEASGLGNGVALLGVGLSTGRPGWGPAANLTGIVVRTRTTFDSYQTERAGSASIGLRYASTTAASFGYVGYTFSDRDDAGVGAVVSPTGGGDGTFVTLQHEYWGTGDRMAQLIGTFNFGSEYLWSRAKATQKLGPVSPFGVGGELIFQGGGETFSLADGTQSSRTFITQLGPVLSFQATESLRFDASAGAAFRTNDLPMSGYARLEFVFVPR